MESTSERQYRADKTIESIAARVRDDFEALVAELNADAPNDDARWSMRAVMGQRIGNALINRAPIMFDDNDDLMVLLRPHTTDDV